MWCGQDISTDIEQLWLLFTISVYFLSSDLTLTFQIIQTKLKPAAMALQPTMDAPKFKGTAVVNGMFKEISLDDYKGKVLVDI